MNCFDSGDPSNNKNIREKINGLRSSLNVLKKKLDLEKTLLNQRKYELFGGNAKKYSEYPRQMQHIQSPTMPTVAISKADLRDIERKCDKELAKLNDYILQVNQLKSTWMEARRTQIPCSAIGRQYSRGKVFYVNNNDF